MKWFAGPLAGVLVALGGGTTPTLARADELVLKPSRDLAPPAPKTETMPAAPARPGQPRPARTPKTEEAPRGVLFLRADRIDGNEDRITAEGDVELRSRYETVLADWLNYDVINDEIWAKGNVVLRRGFDWITGPELRFTRDTEIGFFKSPRFFVADARSESAAAPRHHALIVEAQTQSSQRRFQTGSSVFIADKRIRHPQREGIERAPKRNARLPIAGAAKILDGSKETG